MTVHMRVQTLTPSLLNRWRTHKAKFMERHHVGVIPVQFRFDTMSCYSCHKPVALGDKYVSKPVNSGRIQYCMKCAERFGLLEMIPT